MVTVHCILGGMKNIHANHSKEITYRKDQLKLHYLRFNKLRNEDPFQNELCYSITF